MNCKQCNTPLQDGATVCPACGTAVETAPQAEQALPSAIDTLLDEAYTAATEQSDFESNTPLTEVYQGEPELIIPGHTYADTAPKKGKKILLSVLIFVLVIALSLTALAYFKVLHIPYLSDWFAPEQPAPATPEIPDTPVYIAPTLSDFSATPTDILVGESAEILFTLHVQNPSEDDLSSLAVFCDEMQICLLSDDGLHGDETAEDGIYSAVVSLTSDYMQDAVLCAKLDLLQSNTVTITFNPDVSEENLSASKALIQTVNDITDYNELKAFMQQNTAKFAGTPVFDDETQTVHYETVYGVSHVWPQSEISLVAES